MDHRWSAGARDTTWSLSVGLVAVWHVAAEWGVRLVFAVLVAVLTPRVGRVFDKLISRIERRWKGPRK